MIKSHVHNFRGYVYSDQLGWKTKMVGRLYVATNASDPTSGFNDARTNYLGRLEDH